MAHTPGPWKANEAEVYGPRFEWVADTENEKLPDNGKANADLIAEAPNLVAALDELMAQFVEVYRGDGWVTDRTYLKACEVLNRIAEGGKSASPAIDWIRVTPAEAFDLLALAAQVDDRTPSEQATIDRLARTLEKRA